jgi:hypothetical protein
MWKQVSLLLLSATVTTLTPTWAQQHDMSSSSNKTAESTAREQIAKDQQDITDLEADIQKVENASPDPTFQKAIDAALQANDTAKASEEEVDMWKTVLDKLTASSNLWSNMSHAEGEMKLNATMKTMNEGEKLAGEHEKLEQLRKATDVAKENIQVSKLSDSILESSTELREGLEHLREYETEFASTKEQFQSSLLKIHALFQQLQDKETGTKGSHEEDAVVIKTDIATKQGVARAQKDRLVSLNTTMEEQRELIATLHDHINRIIITKTFDNTTTGSPHTRAMEAKLNVMEHLITSMASNVSMESTDLLNDKNNEEKMANMESEASTKSAKLNDKMKKAAAQYANASAILNIDMDTKTHASKTYEEGKAVDESERRSKTNKLKADIESKKVELQLSEEKLNGEIEAEKTANDAAAAQDVASDALKKAEELSFESKEKEMLAEHPNVEDSVAPWAESDMAADQQTDSAQKIRHIVSHLLWSEGHSESAKAASMDIVNAVHGYDSSSISAQDASTTQHNENRLKGAQDTQHLSAKIAGIHATTLNEKDARFKRIAPTRPTSVTSPLSVSISTSPVPAPTTRVVTRSLASVTNGVKRSSSSSYSSSSDEPVLSAVPDTCFDGIKDGKELGVDCGGDCNRQCGVMTTFIKHDANTYHSISIVPRDGENMIGNVQKEKEMMSPKIVKKLPAEIVARSQKNAQEKASKAPQTVFLPGEEGVDQVVEGQWKEIAADSLLPSFLEKTPYKNKLRSQHQRR